MIRFHAAQAGFIRDRSAAAGLCHNVSHYGYSITRLDIR